AALPRPVPPARPVAGEAQHRSFGARNQPEAVKGGVPRGEGEAAAEPVIPARPEPRPPKTGRQLVERALPKHNVLLGKGSKGNEARRPERALQRNGSPGCFHK